MTEQIEPTTKAANHYVDNAKFLTALLEHRQKVLEAKEAGTELPQISNYLGECFVKIAEHLSYKANFIGYPFRDEMVGDAIENCLSVVNNFDPAKSKNPFAYFTQITFYAFVRRITKEKKQLQTKFRYIDQLDISEIITQEQDNGDFQNQFLEYLKSQTDNYEYEKIASSVTKTNKKKLDSDDIIIDSSPEL